MSRDSFQVSVEGRDSFEYCVGRLKIVGYGRPRLRRGAAWIASTDLVFGDELISAWNTCGLALSEQLDGDYVLAAWNGETGQGLISVDRFSTHSLYWQSDSGVTAFATKPVRVAELLGKKPRIDPNALFAYLYFHVVPAPLSVCEGVSRLDVGECLKVLGGCGDITTYWVPEFSESTRFNFADQRAGFFDSLREGVSQSVSGFDRSEVGSFLSGGTDSSTLAGLLTEVNGQPARTFSIVFDQKKYDEREFSRCAAAHFGTDHTEHLLTPEETESSIYSIAASYEQPFGNSSAVPTLACAKIAKSHGVNHLLGGDGGDELFGGNSRYARAWVLSHYQRVPESIRKNVIEPLLLEKISSEQRFWLIRKLQGYTQQASVPLPDQLDARYNLLNRFGPETILSPGFLRAIDPNRPLALQRQVWSRTNEQNSLVNQLLAYDFKFTLGDNDLPKVTRMCHAAGVSVAFPMLADRMVSFAAHLPAKQKLDRTHLRKFFRQALRGYLPDLILDKSKHGFGMPFGEWLLTQPSLSALASETLSSLASRRLIREDFVRSIQERISSGHAGYFGTMIWILMMLELWLRQSPFSDLEWSD